MFYDKFLELCNQKNKAPSIVADELGFARSSITKWKSGATLRSANLKRVADYFGVPVSYFSEEAPETEKAPVSDKETEDFTKYFAMLTPEHRQQIRSAMAELIKEQLQG